MVICVCESFCRMMDLASRQSFWIKFSTPSSPPKKPGRGLVLAWPSLTKSLSFMVGSLLSAIVLMEREPKPNSSFLSRLRPAPNLNQLFPTNRKNMKRSKTPPKKILLIDDENDFTELLAANLEEAGHFAVTQVNDPRQATAKAREVKPDICVIDLVMPKMDGGDVINAMKNDPDLAKIPVLMLTALVEENMENPEEAQIRGGLPFVSKTSDLEVIIKAINERV